MAWLAFFIFPITRWLPYMIRSSWSSYIYITKTYHQLVVLISLVEEFLLLKVYRVILFLTVLLTNQLFLDVVQCLVGLWGLVDTALLCLLDVLEQLVTIL